jgi:hypothetical protein
MDGFLMAKFYSSKQLCHAGNDWLAALKQPAEAKP